MWLFGCCLLKLLIVEVVLCSLAFVLLKLLFVEAAAAALCCPWWFSVSGTSQVRQEKVELDLKNLTYLLQRCLAQPDMPGL